ncbi:MAG: tetraacyldisaccharide 4'-kinase [Gammaproteobacteria bacterium]|nr:tetraacyldisaccharide 4'-kinase [Gammaproteobacteria bacterium]MCP5459134.1 tetraacyldisaccharide 4'-kinase [Gammaproteobacteria bacterium]
MLGLTDHWYAPSPHPLTIALKPLSWLFCGLAVLRRQFYYRGLLRMRRINAPVMVVGNLSVGGTGKTPLVIRLVELLREAGWRPGVVSRGYGGTARHWPRYVTAESDPREVGDEPVVLASRARCPVIVDPDRVAAAQALVNNHACDVVIADDGLQHYRLARDIEILVIDGQRRFGNGECLPAGPLREPLSRLRDVTFVVGNGQAQANEYLMTLISERAVNLRDPAITCHLAAFSDELVRAVAAIGNPQRFFDDLRARGIRLVEYPYPDHYPFTEAELDFKDELPVLMTEKDAVKYRPWAKDGHWYVPVTAQVDSRLEQQLLSRLAQLTGKPSP